MKIMKVYLITVWGGHAVPGLGGQPPEAVVAVGGLVVPEQGGDVGLVHNQHVPGHDLLLGHQVPTFRFREFHLQLHCAL